MKLVLGLTALLFAIATPAISTQAGPHVLVAGPTQVSSVSYGTDVRQKATLYTRGSEPAPLIVYLHGGGWSAGSPSAGSRGRQAEHFTAAGYAYATVGYRFVPNVTVEQQLGDVAAAIAALQRQSEVDPRRIVLIGHSSGGHMAALLGTDQSYLERAGIPFQDLRAVILLDPAILNIPGMLDKGGAAIDRFFRPAFGDEPGRQGALSPTRHTEAPNAPAWLTLHDPANGFAASQGAELSAALLGAGAKEATVVPIPGTTHMRLNGDIGAPQDAATAAIDAFLARSLPENRRPRFR